MELQTWVGVTNEVAKLLETTSANLGSSPRLDLGGEGGRRPLLVDSGHLPLNAIRSSPKPRIRADNEENYPNKGENKKLR
jgi:hypothetical protein